jgi:rod shape-determining protein MreC
VTSGFSDIFPGNLFIGRVTDFKLEGGSNFYSITVELSNDISREQYVYVIDNLMQKELNEFKE